MKMIRMVAVATIMMACCSVLMAQAPTNEELGRGMLSMGREIGSVKRGMLSIGTEIGSMKSKINQLQPQAGGVNEKKVINLINERAVTLNSKDGELSKLRTADAENNKTASDAKKLAENSVFTQEIELAAEILVAKGLKEPTSQDAAAAWSQAKTLLAIVDPLERILAIAKATTIAPADLSGYMETAKADAKFALKTGLDQEVADRKAGDEAVIAKIPTCEQLSTFLANFLTKEGYLTKAVADVTYDAKGSSEEAADKVKADLATQIATKADQKSLAQVQGDMKVVAGVTDNLVKAGGWGRDKKDVSKARNSLQKLFEQWKSVPQETKTKAE